MKHSVLRFQCDPCDAADPEIAVFLRKTIEADGKQYHIDEWGNPVRVRFSDLGSMLDLKDAEKVLKAADGRAKAIAAERVRVAAEAAKADKIKA